MASEQSTELSSLNLQWKIGVEIELLAPPGVTRADLAAAVAAEHGGSVRIVLHQDSEPSAVPGQPVFYNLTLGFEALDADSRLLVRCVDDLTLQHDLNRQAQPRPGWWRILSDDERLLRLIDLHTDPSLPLPDALSKLAPMFNGQLLAAPGGIFRLIDSIGAPLALAAPLPGERERPCELITPPLLEDHAQQIEALLATARGLGFSIPLEGATHVHFDAEPLCSAHAMANLVNLLWTWGPRLRQLCATPPHFRRVGGWPETLLECVNQDDFRALPWPQARARLRALEPSKYCDFNVKNIAYAREDRHTFEARIFPAYTDTVQVIAAAALFEGILRHCCKPTEITPADLSPWRSEEVTDLLDQLPLDAAALRFWKARAAEHDRVPPVASACR